MPFCFRKGFSTTIRAMSAALRNTTVTGSRVCASIVSLSVGTSFAALARDEKTTFPLWT
jgi:hypothetical protein